MQCATCAVRADKSILRIFGNGRLFQAAAIFKRICPGTHHCGRDIFSIFMSNVYCQVPVSFLPECP